MNNGWPLAGRSANNPSAFGRINVSQTPAHEDIAQLAYTLWQRRGYASGSAESDWLEAERALQEPVFQSRS